MPAQPLLRFGPYRLEGTSGQLWRDTRVVHLPPKAAAALWCLATQAGRVVTRAGTELAARVAAAADTVPPGVQQLIELQPGQLSADERRLLDMDSIAGVEFAVASVAAGLEAALDLVEERCEVLAQRGAFLEAGGLAAWPDGTVSGRYRFRHVLYQQVLYRWLTQARRVQGHRRIGMRLEAGYGHRPAEIAPVLAVHFARGQDAERAITYHAQAGQQVLVQSTHQEAIGHVTSGLELLSTLPESSRHVEAEIKLQTALGTALLATQGFTAPAVAQAYQRVRELSQQASETPEVFQALWGLYQFYSVRGEHQTALAEQLLALAQRAQDQVSLVVGYFAVGGTGYYLGEFATSCTVLPQAEGCYERQ